jgi:serine/threonine-protein kinase
MAFGWWRSAQPKDEPPVVLDIDLGPKLPAGNRTGADVIVSSDGTQIVYVAEDRLWTRRLDGSSARSLPQTEGAYAPFFSPDGQWVAFFAEGKLKRILLSGGGAEILCDAVRGMGGAWAQDGTIIATLEGNVGLSRVHPGDRPVPVTQLTGAAMTHRWPQVLPGGNAVLFTSHTSPLAGFDEAEIVAVTLRNGRQKTIWRGGTYGRYVPTGHLLYVRGGSLFAVPFDPDRLEVRGKPERILEGVNYSSLNGSAQFDLSRTGALIYRSGGENLVTIDWLDASGSRRPLMSTPGEYVYPTISPDGQRIAMVVVRGSKQEIWTYDWQRDVRSRITQDQLFNTNPCWTPNGRYLLFQSVGGMFWVRADGTGSIGQLTKSKAGSLQYPWSFAAGGSRLAYSDGYIDARGADLWTMALQDNGTRLQAGEPELFLRTPANERHPSFSPDGGWLAYDSNGSGTNQIYVVSFPGKAHKVQISSDGGQFPIWSRRRNELFFRSEDNRIMVASYEIRGESLVPQKARVWSEARLAERLNANRNFDVTPDGTRVAALMPANNEEPASRNRVVFWLNFFDELRRRAHP